MKDSKKVMRITARAEDSNRHPVPLENLTWRVLRGKALLIEDGERATVTKLSDNCIIQVRGDIAHGPSKESPVAITQNFKLGPGYQFSIPVWRRKKPKRRPAGNKRRKK